MALPRIIGVWCGEAALPLASSSKSRLLIGYGELSAAYATLAIGASVAALDDYER
jgi:hypothetical protein